MINIQTYTSTPKRIWITILFLEIIYVIVARTIEHFYSVYNFEAEIYRSINRIVIFTITYIIFKDFIFKNKPNYTSMSSFAFMFAILIFLLVPLLEGYMGELEQSFKIFFGITSIFVALHEEIIYRGIVQRLLLERFSTLKAILITSLIFTAYHIGSLDFYINLYIQVFLASVILGIIYIKINSFGLIVFLHALYDFIPSLTPIDTSGPIVTYQEATYIMISSLIILLIWYKNSRNI